MENTPIKIYLDDVRTPINSNDWAGDWIVVRDYEEFVKKVEELGLENIHIISLDHDLGDTAMHEYYKNVSPNFTLNYDNIREKTGMDCAKWLVDHWLDKNANRTPSRKLHGFPQVYTHSANPIGSANIMGYINNFLMNMHAPQTCIRVKIPHTV
jgi:hypothetical protein